MENIKEPNNIFDRSQLPDDWSTSIRFVNWRLEDTADRKACKIPYDPKNPNQRASSTDPATWGTLDQALARDPEHVGKIVGTPDVSVDFDKCREPLTGVLDAWAKDLIDSLPPTYSEVSPSGRGIHLWFKGKPPVGRPPKDGYRAPDLECYTARRYFTLTTRRLAGTPREIAPLSDAQMRQLIAAVEARKEQLKAPKTSVPGRKARTNSSAKFQSLKEGNFEAAGFTDVSAAVQSLLTLLAVEHRLDREAIEADFKASGMYRDFSSVGHANWIKKWEIRGNEELDKAIHQAGTLLPPAEAIPINAGQPGNEAILASERILVTKPELLYFKRSGDLVRPVLHMVTETDDQAIRRDRLAVTIQTLTPYAIIRDLEANGEFVTGAGLKWRKAIPTEALANHLIDRVRQGQAKYRELDSVVSSPTLLRSGNVLEERGSFQEGVFYLFPNAKFAPVPPEPTLDEAQAALAKFGAIFHRFPFVPVNGEEWNQTPAYAAVLASTLSVAARTAIPTVPLFAVTCPTYGGGKTKIPEAVSSATLGHLPTKCDYVNDEEFAKTLVPLLRSGDRAVLIDNVSARLRGDRLSTVLTSEEHQCRILGQSETVRLLNRAVFFATGINLAIEGDLAARRTLLIDINPNCERPEERDFDFDPVIRARESYPELVVAALTALRAYIVAGKPKVLKRPLLGSFEKWDELVCGCLVWCGFADPCRTRDQVITQDPQREADLKLLSTWNAALGEGPVTLEKVREIHSLQQQLCVRDAWDPRAISWRLRKIKGKVIGGFVLNLETKWDGARYFVTSRNSAKNNILEQQKEIF